MAKHLFELTDYKDVIRRQLKENRSTRGFQAQMASAAGCGSSFFSQVMHTHVHLTPDQAAGLTKFWGFGEDETEFFISLVHLARTNSKTYQNFLEKRIREISERNREISKQVRSERMATADEALLYYSAWFWSAIHIATSIPKLRSVSALAKRFSVPEDQVEETLAELQRMGMVERHGQSWQALNRSYHLERHSPLIGIHHTNWRQRALVSAQLRKEDSLHYSVVHSLSVEDFEQLKTMLLTFIGQSKKLVEKSNEEEIIAVNLDCFRL